MSTTSPSRYGVAIPSEATPGTDAYIQTTTPATETPTKRPHYKPCKDLFDLEKAETNVNWKIRANLWVKARIVFIFVSVSVASDS
ncbi:hypothetical protein H5410_005043 [Solanum commersonii]|uniref:Uncharacterized protein n=1 Tax=Solanum commersonii TaxID=4109 RepID=A0A9J6A5K8_SOLCO|nr:hypothetical protein H5410_005043 [Solanum commersonii]